MIDQQLDTLSKIKIAQPYLDKFETDKMRLYCQDMIEQIPNYIFYMPSSTSGKYHNKTQCQEHGQIYHIIMFAEILNYILSLKGYKEKFPSPEQRDAMRCIPWFHDALKCKDGATQFTVHEHPMLAGKWVRETHVEHDIEDKIKNAIACMCERHSGEFTSSKRSKTILLEPGNMMELIIHTCDILSSRNNIDMQPPEYLKSIFNDKPIDINNYVISFGKYKDHKLIDVYKHDKDYLRWAEENIRKPDFILAIQGLNESLKNEGDKLNDN